MELLPSPIHYVEGAKAAKNEVKLISLGNQSFDPVLHKGYITIKQIASDLVTGQAAIAWAQHLVFIYPIRRGAMPAFLKGFIERVILPGFAFKYREGSQGVQRTINLIQRHQTRYCFKHRPHQTVIANITVALSP